MKLSGQVMLFEQYRLLRKTWFWVLLLSLMATAGMAYYAYYVVEPEFMASVVAVPPNKSGTPLDNLFGNIAASLKDAALGRLVGRSGSENGYTRTALLMSRSVQDSLIARYDLYRHYDIPKDRPDLMYGKITENIDIEPQNEGPITISVYDTDPKLAQKMASDIVGIANSISRELNRRESEPITQYVEQRYLQVKRMQDSLQLRLGGFMESTRLFAPEEQAAVISESVQKTEIEIGRQRARVQVLTEQLGPDDPQVLVEKTVLAQLEEQGRKFAAGNVGVLPGVKLNSLPKSAVDYLDIKGNYEVNAKVLALLEPMYEQMKLEEVRNIPVLNILDAPFVPPTKARPKRALMVGGGFLGAFIACYLVIAIVSYFQNFNRRYRAYVVGSAPPMIANTSAAPLPLQPPPAEAGKKVVQKIEGQK